MTPKEKEKLLWEKISSLESKVEQMLKILKGAKDAKAKK